MKSSKNTIALLLILTALCTSDMLAASDKTAGVSDAMRAAMPEYLTATEAVTFATYSNIVRNWGIVGQIYTSPADPEAVAVNGDLTIAGAEIVVGFESEGEDGEIYRWQCAADRPDIGCDQIAAGESILVNGHQEDFIMPGCLDGFSNIAVVNGLYRCQGSTPGNMSGPCVLLSE